MNKIIIIILMACSLSACLTPMRLGISEAEWKSYNSEERKKIKTGYYQILKHKLSNSEEVISDGSVAQVRIFGGKATMPPFAKPSQYTPVEFQISNGDSQTVTLDDPSETKSVRLKVYYLNKTLYLDPSHYDPSKCTGSIQLHCSPIWNRGFTYQKVSSSGYVHLDEVNVTVKKFNNDAPTETEDS